MFVCVHRWLWCTEQYSHSVLHLLYSSERLQRENDEKIAEEERIVRELEEIAAEKERKQLECEEKEAEKVREKRELDERIFAVELAKREEEEAILEQKQRICVAADKIAENLSEKDSERARLQREKGILIILQWRILE